MSERHPSRLDSALRIVADVRPGEGATVVLLALDVLLLLLAYYVLKPVREALILGHGSAELKSYMSVGQVALLLVVVPLYARLTTRMSRIRVICLVTWFFITCLLAFYLLGGLRVPLGMVFFLWLGVFSLMVVAQFWSFANDLYTNQEGERLFPVIGFGSSLGAVLGSLVANRAIGPLGVHQLLLVGAGVLVLQLQLTAYIDRRHARRRDAPPIRRTAASQPVHSHNAFALVFRSPYLLSIGLMLLLFFVVDATGEYILGSAVKDRAETMVAAGQSHGLPVDAVIGRFYSRYFALVNVIGLFVQLFVVSRVVKYLGVGYSVAVLPMLATFTFTTIAFSASLGLMLGALVADKSTEYSLDNTVRNMLFLPCTREEKYGAKQVIDSVFVRLGDVAAAMLVFVGTALLGLSMRGFAKVTIGLAVLGIALAVVVGHGYRRRTRVMTEARPALRSVS